MPNFFIRERKVVRFIPRRAAAPSAPPTRPLQAVSARTISSRCLLSYSSATLVWSLGKLLHKITHQLWNVFLTFPQRWYPDRKYMQAVVQITSEFAGCNHLFEIAIGRRDEPNIGSSRVSAP